MANSATTPPTCSLCGKEHWLRDGHDFGNAKAVHVQLMSPRPKSQRERQMVDITPARLEAARKVLDDAPVPKLDRVWSMPDGTTVAGPKSKARGRPATGFDKKAYDREKAKERRAAAKAAK